MIVFFYVQEFYNGDLLNCERTHDKMGRTAQVSDGILFFHKKYCRNCMILLSKQVFIVLICWFLFYIFFFVCFVCMFLLGESQRGVFQFTLLTLWFWAFKCSSSYFFEFLKCFLCVISGKYYMRKLFKWTMYRFVISSFFSFSKSYARSLYYLRWLQGHLWIWMMLFELYFDCFGSGIG